MNLAETPLYGLRRSGQQHGTVSTKPDVVAYMLDLADYVSERNLSQVRLLDPAGGDGVFILSAIRRLSASANRYGFSFARAYNNLCVVEIDLDSALNLRENILTCLNELGRLNEITEPESIVINGDFLQVSVTAVDVVIGNPPYVRYDNIPVATRDFYRQQYKTFSHRADLYVPFFEKGLRLLNAKGKLCYLCANRWLKNEYGQGLRSLIVKGHTLSVVVDLESANPFEEDVNAYPAITLIENRFSDHPVRWYSVDTVDELPTLAGEPPKLLPRPQTSDWEQCFRSHRRSRTIDTIEAQGFKIGIGVATGADRVFIGTDLDIESSRLLPLLTSRDLRGDQFVWGGRYLVNPYELTGELVDLNNYPRLAQYLNYHSKVLRQRHVAKKNPLAWYRTIDRVYPQLTKQPKLLLPDMSANQRLFLDEGSFYLHHNLYFITGLDTSSLKVLGALLMTPTVRSQLAQLTTRMNGGYLRWQSQHLRKLLLPTLASFSTAQFQQLLLAFDEGNGERAEDVLSK